MSDDILSVIPTDPYWQPDPAAATRTAAMVENLVSGPPDASEVDIDVTWHEMPAFVDCGQNLERIGCPRCGAEIDTEWWGDFMDEHDGDGFTSLAVELPCCRTVTTLDTLEYEWPCGFARFEIAIWNPERARFSDEELTTLAAALGHPVKQVWAHV
ncbi:hypothetical protein [Streptomyces sp. NPDC006638]|uniref:hypothetical protein n=1 Tax=Streptomyces sp. NPDC006638 TaxID=3157183 RepID=UPI0033A1D2DD